MDGMLPVEAKLKWCPSYRSSDPHSDNRAGRCLAEDCADWVWVKPMNPTDPVTHGYCGLTHPE